MGTPTKTTAKRKLRRPNIRWTTRVRDKFLAQLRANGNVTDAARRCGIARDRLYELRGREPEFAQAWEAAIEQAIDRLEKEAWRRAVTGTNKPVTYQGEITAHYKEYSDRLLEFLLRANRPDKYRDRVSTEHSGPGGGPISVKAHNALTDDELDARIRELTTNLILPR